MPLIKSEPGLVKAGDQTYMKGAPEQIVRGGCRYRGQQIGWNREYKLVPMLLKGIETSFFVKKFGGGEL